MAVVGHRHDGIGSAAKPGPDRQQRGKRNPELGEPARSERIDLISKTVASWFNPAVFSVPTGTGTDIYGNLGFNALRGPGRDQWNPSLFKSFVISESRGSRFELRADAFNTWNHTQFKGDVNNGGISLNAGSGNFGAVTAAFDPREFQLGTKLTF